MKKNIDFKFNNSKFLNAEILFYGLGGPALALKELTLKFEERIKAKVIVIESPTPAYIDKVK